MSAAPRRPAARRGSPTVVARAVGTALAAVLLLSGCAGDVRGDLRALVGDVTVSANAGDADAVRRGVSQLLARLEDAVRGGDVTPAEAEVIRDRALAVQAAADLIDEDLIARREAERAAEQARAELEAERKAAEEAERQRMLEEQRRAQEEDAEKERQKQLEEQRREEEENKKEDDDGQRDGSPSPTPTSTAAP